MEERRREVRLMRHGKEGCVPGEGSGYSSVEDEAGKNAKGGRDCRVRETGSGSVLTGRKTVSRCSSDLRAGKVMNLARRKFEGRSC